MSRNIVVFINAVRGATFKALKDHEIRTGQKLTPIVLVDQKIKDSITERNAQKHHETNVKVISADFDSPTSIRNALREYEDSIFAVTAQYENSIHELKKLVPYLPYINMPTQGSLEWATEKKHMRELLESYDKSLVPGYLVVNDILPGTIHDIEKKLHYPLIVKPSGLEGSLLVSMVHNREELKKTIEQTFEHIQNAYDIWVKRQNPAVLVEEFMEGEMYSVDTYVGRDGKCHNTPVVRVYTGRSVGFDDFFGYMRITPSGLNETDNKNAQAMAEKACHALNLRSITVHTELMKTPQGWKVIELGPRMGGYRHDMYNMSYGINHIANDLLIRADIQPHVPLEILGTTAVFNIYAKSEGKLISTSGKEKIERLESCVSIKKMLKDGDHLRFAKNNGDPVFEVTFFNTNLNQLEKDIQALEKNLHINVKTEK